MAPFDKGTDARRDAGPERERERPGLGTTPVSVRAGMSSPPPGRSFRLVLLTTFATFSALYVPQPLLPLLGERFDATPARVALLMTVVFVPLAVAPLAYGAILRRFSAQRLLVGATALLGALQIAGAAAPSLSWLLVIRALGGFLFPAILTAAVTYCSGAGDAAAVSRRVATYVATTIVGGLAGRLIGGFSGDALGWRTTFVLVGLLLLACSALLSLAARDAPLASSRGNLAASLEILSTRRFAAGFALIFLAFFAFSGCLNALPFRLVELEPGLSARRISLVYLGYLVGVAIALNAERLARLVGGPVRVMGAALATFALGLALMWQANATALIATGFLISGGLFAVHATLSGHLNGLRPDEASLVNGLYIAIYYAAGAAGSVLPLALYQAYGWTVFLGTMLLIVLMAGVPLVVLARHSAAEQTS